MIKALALLCVSSLLRLSSSKIFDSEDLLGCTALVAGKLATHDGSVLNAYTSDSRQSDFRIGKVNSNSFEDGAKRHVVEDRSYYPRYIGYERGELYHPEKVERGFYAWKMSEPIGSIPQVKKTHGYIDASYAVMNEKQVAIGESTCGAKFSARPVYAGGSALFCINELSRLALERANSAKEAIQIMGDLAEEYGFYGAEFEDPLSESTAGETLTVTDPEEAWVFQILPDDTGKSAIWAAQRVADDHVAVIGNQFSIRQINLDDSDNYLASKNIFEVAKRQNLWTPKEEGNYKDFNFMQTYGRFPIAFVEQTDLRLIWAARRPWRLMNLFAPSLNLPPSKTLADYPFSVKVDEKLHIRNIFAALRDHYEGTPYDLTKGFGAGPFGDPNRFGGVPEGVTSNLTRRGNFERPVSVTSVAYNYVAQSRSWLPSAIGGRVFFSPHSPHSGTPSVVYPHAYEMPKSLSTGSVYKFTFEANWWVFCLVTNYVQKAWVHLYPEVQRTRDDLENYLYVTSDVVETGIAKLQGDEVTVRSKLTEWQQKYADKVLHSWTRLFEDLVTKFHDGGMVNSLTDKDISYTPKPWPLWWLEQAGYFRVAAHDIEPLVIPVHTDDPPISLNDTYPGSLSSISPAQQGTNLYSMSITNSLPMKVQLDILSFLSLAFLFTLLGIYLGNKIQKFKRQEYEDLDL